MKNCNNGKPVVPVEFLYQVKYRYLVADVKICRRLVQQKEFRFLRERLSENGPLPFAAGQLVQFPVFQIDYVREFKVLPYRFIIFFFRFFKPVLVREPAQHDEFLYGKRERNVVKREHRGDVFRENMPRDPADVFAAKEHLACGQAYYPAYSPEKRCLAGAVRPYYPVK
ncbi:MAG: hypothetical protein ABII64_01630 [Elusimicrobiota bacterium]